MRGLNLPEPPTLVVKCVLLLAWVPLPTVATLAVEDVLILKNGDKITGEIKKMERSYIHIEPDYADNVFIIEWEQVEKLESQEHFVALTEAGERISGSIRSDPGEPEQLLIEDEDTSIPIPQRELIDLKPVDEKFWGRFGVAIDFGLSITKANDTKQLTTRGLVSYVSERRSLQGNVNLLRNAQKDVDDTKRSEAGANYRRFFGERWFVAGLADFLKSDELQLDLRTSAGGGLGRYLGQNSAWEFALIGGAQWTRENYLEFGTLIGTLRSPLETVTPTKHSAEALGALELNVFNIGDIDIYTRFSALPSLTESGRVRLNFSHGFRWELPKDLFFGITFTSNYGSRPIAEAPKSDYIFGTSVG